MTKGQILTYCIIARCAYAKYAAKVALLGLIGDISFGECRINLILVNKYIKILTCYDPSLTTNCISSDDIMLVINRVSEILGLCGDPLSLDETTSNCCDPLYGVTIANP